MTGVPTQISFRGVEATYHDEERRLMRELVEGGASADELLSVHQIIAEFDATLVEGDERGAAGPCCRPSLSTSVVNLADGALSEAGGSPAASREPHQPPASKSVPTGHGSFSIPDRVVEQMKKDR